MGSVSIPIKDVFKILFKSEGKDSWIYIINNFRLTKSITAIIVGISLSVAGLLMQTLFRNPLAGPYVLGISSGAGLGVALVVLASTFSVGFASLYTFLGNWTIIIAAIIGASLVLILVVMVSFKISDTVSLLIIGIMFGSLTGAVVTVLQYFSNPDNLQSFLSWTFGSLSTVNWKEMKFLVPLTLIGLGIAFIYQKSLNVILFGDNYAKSLGISIKKLRFIIIVCTALMAGTTTAFTGPIAFIGVAVPHLARGIFKTSDHKILIPGIALIGASLMLICDILSRVPGYDTLLPINAVTALFGAPVVIWVIIKSRSINSNR